MKKSRVILLIFTINSLISAKEFILNNKPNLDIKLGDRVILTYTYKDGLNKNTNWVLCKNIDYKMRLIKKDGSVVKGFKWIFKAIKSGDSKIILTISKVGKGKDKIENREYKLSISQ